MFSRLFGIRQTDLRLDIRPNQYPVKPLSYPTVSVLSTVFNNPFQNVVYLYVINVVIYHYSYSLDFQLERLHTFRAEMAAKYGAPV